MAIWSDFVDFAANTITRQLVQWNCRDNEAWDQLLPQVYDELKLKARQLLSRHRQDTLHPTMLVHELYLDFKHSIDAQWESRQHFFAVVSLAMRQIIVDAAHKRNAAKRGGNLVRMSPTEAELTVEDAEIIDVIDLDKAMETLEGIDPIACRIIEMRYFAGLSLSEVSRILHVSERTVSRKWTWAKTWLFAKLHPIT